MFPELQDFSDLYSVFGSKGLAFPKHLHTHVELCYAVRGGSVATVGSQIRKLEDGGLVIVFPNRQHSYACEDGEGENILAICPAAACPDFEEVLRTKHPRMPFLTAGQLHRDVHGAFRSLVEAVEEKESVEVIKAYVHLILARTLPKMGLLPNRTGSQDEVLRLIEYVGEHFAEPLSLAGIGEALEMSPFRVSRIFSERLHETFPGYLNALRVQHAQMLLQSTAQDILAIAYACGYETSRTFNREFKRHCGCTPREYRNSRRLTVQGTGECPPRKQKNACDRK